VRCSFREPGPDLAPSPFGGRDQLSHAAVANAAERRIAPAMLH
jgi:hypothetical protein